MPHVRRAEIQAARAKAGSRFELIKVRVAHVKLSAVYISLFHDKGPNLLLTC